MLSLYYLIKYGVNKLNEVINIKLNKKEISLIEELVTEFLYQHPQLNDIEYDNEGNPYEYKDGYISYDSYGPTKIKEINQLTYKLKSFT